MDTLTIGQKYKIYLSNREECFKYLQSLTKPILYKLAKHLNLRSRSTNNKFRLLIILIHHFYPLGGNIFKHYNRGDEYDNSVVFISPSLDDIKNEVAKL